MLWKTEVTAEYRRIYETVPGFDTTDAHVPEALSPTTQPSNTFNAATIVNNAFNITE